MRVHNRGKVAPDRLCVPASNQRIECCLGFAVGAVATEAAAVRAARKNNVQALAHVGAGAELAIHFLPSMVLVWIAAMLYSRIKEADDGTRTPALNDVIRNLAIVAAVALGVVLMTGTMVTGS